MGNLYSIKCALEKVGFKTVTGLSRLQLEQADALIFPGVGDFSAASKNLASIKGEMLELVNGGLPVLGICLGMQLLFQKSEEGDGEGLALLEGKNVRLPNSVKVPHMGWNTVRIVAQCKLVEGLKDGAYFYFAHSYYPVPADKRVICAETNYGVTFASVTAKRNICGTQFHPEKSGKDGFKFLENFSMFVKR